MDFTFSSAGDLTAGFAFQLINDLILYNAEDCTYWVVDSFSDLLNGFLILSEENRPFEAVFSFAYSLHKTPVAYYSCLKLNKDYALIVDFYNTFAL